MKTEPENEHRWLHRLLGKWTYESEVPGQAGQPPQQASGTESVSALGELWVLCEGRGQMPGGGDASSLMTLGYDPRTKRFVGSWIGSMMTHLWIYDGWLDDTQKVLTLESEGPDFDVPGKLARYRDVIEWRSDDHRLLSGQVQRADGGWQTFMTVHYRRSGPGPS